MDPGGSSPVSSSTRDRVIALRTQNPGLTLQQIGNECGITREAVRKHLVKAGLPTKAASDRRCYFCNRRVEPGGYRRRRPNKNIPFAHYRCLSCAKEQKKAKIVLLECDDCHLLFPRPARIVRAMAKRGYQHKFCSRKCMGKWLADNTCRAGIRKTRKTKWDYEAVWQERQRTGWGVRRLSKHLVIPVSTVSLILRKMHAKEAIK